MPLPQENVTITKGQRSRMHFISLDNASQEIAFSLAWLKEDLHLLGVMFFIMLILVTFNVCNLLMCAPSITLVILI